MERSGTFDFSSGAAKNPELRAGNVLFQRIPEV